MSRARNAAVRRGSGRLNAFTDGGVAQIAARELRTGPSTAARLWSLVHAPADLVRIGGSALRRLARRTAARRPTSGVAREQARPPRVGGVEWGDWRRLAPVDGRFGRGRGLPIDRFYAERFFRSHAADVRGRVLEVGARECAPRSGGEGAVPGDLRDGATPGATVTRVRDLAAAGALPDDTFDCVILDQVLHLTDDVPAALAASRRSLRADGVLLLSVPGTAGPVHGDAGAGTWHRAFTELSVRRLLGECFQPDAVTVGAHGNVLAATALLQGLAADELSDEELSFDDPQFPVVIVARARKGGDERPDPSVPAVGHRPAVRS